MSEQHVPEWTVGDRMAKARTVAGLSPKDLAEYLDVHPTTIGLYERSLRPARGGVLRLWAIRCDVPLDWLRYGTDTPGDPGDAATNRYFPRLYLAA